VSPLRIVITIALVATVVPSRALADDATRTATPTHKLTKPPRIQHFVEAPYPESEKAAARAATVVLKLAIDANGAVTNAVVVESAGPLFDAAAVSAARQFTFDPAEVDGLPSPIQIVYRYEFVLRAEARPVATFAGLVVDRRTKHPLVGVGVILDGNVRVTTDAEGRFSFDALPPGTHSVALSGQRVTQLETTETLDAGRRLDVTYSVDVEDGTSQPSDDKDDLEVVVAPPALTKQAVSTQVSASEARLVPGAQGDVLKVVENLPGVARPALGSSQLVVWGAAPQDTRVYVDGVPIPTLYHQGGFRSVIHSDVVQSVDLAPGGWAVDYGRGIGGLVNVDLKPLGAEGFHGSAASDLLDSSADVRAHLGHDVTVEVAGRKSYLDALLPAFTSENVGQFIPIPRYYDAQARIVWQVSPSETVELGGLISGDSVQDNVPSEDPTNVESQSHDTSFQRVWLRWKKQTSDGAEITVVPSFGANSDSLVDQFGAVPTALDVSAVVASLRATWQKRVAAWVTAQIGVDAELTSSQFSRTGSNTSPPRTGDDFVFGEPPSGQIAHDDGSSVATSVAPFAMADIAMLGDRLHIVPGVRVEPYVTYVSRTVPADGTNPAVGLFEEQSMIEPRLSARWSPLPSVTFKGAYGLYHEAPQPSDLSSVFGNPTLGPETAEHLLGGLVVGTPDVLSVETTAFRVTSQGLAVRSPLASPLVAQALVPTGVGRTLGIQFLIRKKLSSKFFGWLTYTLSRSQRAEAEGAPFYPYDYDQTNVLAALASYDLGHGFDVGARFRYATGYPRTPVVGAYFDAKSGLYEPIFGALNSIRIPDFYELDARVSKRFAMGSTAIEVYLDVQNVTDHANAEELVYSLDYSQRRTLTGLPILPVLGARFTW
jgi:TonB family protein